MEELMNEKKARFVMGIVFVLLVSVFITGCRTAPAVPTADIAGLAVAGGIEAGRLEQVGRELERISGQARIELGRISASTGELASIIRTVFDIAFGLCDEVEALREGIIAGETEQQNSADNTGNLVGN
jgi:hypothetical protein